MLALTPVAIATIVALPTPVLLVAVVIPVAVPVTPELTRFSPFTKPLRVSVSVGFAAPYKRLWLSAVTVRCALLISAVVVVELLTV